MGNRAYLYATDTIPDRHCRAVDISMQGISENRSYIPLVFKILVSGHAVACRSAIWDEPEPIAVAGHYDEGVARLFDFLDRIKHPAIGPLRDEARQYLSDEKNKRRFFLLECGEIYWFHSKSSREQNEDLLAQIKNIQVDIDNTVADLSGTKPRSWMGRLLDRVLGVRSVDALYEIGLGDWSEILWYDCRGDEHDDLRKMPIRRS